MDFLIIIKIINVDKDFYDYLSLVISQNNLMLKSNTSSTYFTTEIGQLRLP